MPHKTPSFNQPLIITQVELLDQISHLLSDGNISSNEIIGKLNELLNKPVQPPNSINIVNNNTITPNNNVNLTSTIKVDRSFVRTDVNSQKFNSNGVILEYDIVKQVDEYVSIKRMEVKLIRETLYNYKTIIYDRGHNIEIVSTNDVGHIKRWSVSKQYANSIIKVKKRELFNKGSKINV